MSGPDILIEAAQQDSVARRLAARLTERDGCWEWGGATNGSGYGRIAAIRGGAKRYLYTHRLAYEILRGPIPAGLQIDHLCRNTLCANPEHLEAVTNRENVLRGKTCALRDRPRATHCRRGHAYAEHGQITAAGWQRCVTCKRMRDPRYRLGRANDCVEPTLRVECVERAVERRAA